MAALASVAYADEPSPPPPLRFYAINAGYKDDNSAQNYDFIELERTVDENLGLADMRIVYTNSVGNIAGEISFSENLYLQSERLLLGSAISPQYSEVENSYYLYDFGSSGLASTAGMLELYQGEHKIDEICWGKMTCDNNNVKFATKYEDNYSLKRCFGECLNAFTVEKYYPELNLESVTELVYEIENEAELGVEPGADSGSESELEPPTSDPSCLGVRVSEIYSYYVSEASEQFIELYNPTLSPAPLDHCRIEYKGADYPLSGKLAAGEYRIFQDSNLVLTKNPTSTNTVSIIDSDNNIIDSVDYPSGQKKGTSYALYDIGTEMPFWRQTYQVTPGAANLYQEFQTCEEGKIINPTTGNCIKQPEQASKNDTIVCPEGKYLNPLTKRCKNIEVLASMAPCKDGYVRNPDTNRCRKIEAATEQAECKEGYERNPETNRCRKIRENVGESADYAPSPIEEAEKYDSPRIFIAISVISTAIIAGVIYVIYQYRQEIGRRIKSVCGKNHKV